MVIKIRKKVFIATICMVLFGIICCFALPRFINLFSKSSDDFIAGGMFQSSLHALNESVPAMNQESEVSSERFQRPSKELPYPNPYSFKTFRRADGASPLVTKKFDNPEDLILAYYGVLREASNMRGYSGGCGTIGWSELPYPYAYELLAKETQEEISLSQFVDSFSGIGYMTLLKLLPTYAPPDTPQGTQYYMVEIEAITGVKTDTNMQGNEGSHFSYYYGLITVVETPEEGWKVKDIDYIPEDFLCAPMHSWFYLSDAVVQIVYGNNMKMIDKIDRIEQKDNIISIYASGNGKSYRFDFVRLTNGYDILLHEYILDNGDWQETSLLTDDWDYMKLAIRNA